MESDGLFLKVSYLGYQHEKLEKTLRKLALSHDGHLVAQGQSLVEPCRRDIEFEFSNRQRMERFIDGLHLGRYGLTITLLAQGDKDKELAWDCG